MHFGERPSSAQFDVQQSPIPLNKYPTTCLRDHLCLPAISKMGRHSTKLAVEAQSLTPQVDVITPPESPASKKRKRDAHDAAEIEIDITAPEPPSKKALRKAQKEGQTGSKVKASKAIEQIADAGGSTFIGDSETSEKTPTRSEFGIWIGNLSWSTTKTELRDFFVKNMPDAADSITRLHLPSPSQHTLMKCQQNVKPQNKGFAYVDFSTEKALKEALNLSEKLFSGRKVLIKDAKNFEGRPEKPASDENTGIRASSGKPPSVRIFVGNLRFETTKEEIREHFEKCGIVEDVFLATFEDSGKCKGYGWVTFGKVEAAEKAVRGWVEILPEAEEEDADEEDGGADVEDGLNDVNEARRPQIGDGRIAKKKSRTRKWWINRLQGRPLRMEFAEGKDVRYKKRYGKGAVAAQEQADEGTNVDDEASTIVKEGVRSSKTVEKPSRMKNMKSYPPKGRVDARSIRPGAALAAAPRLTGGIVESTGTKTTFEL